MWDRPDALNRAADLLVTLALALVIGGAVHALVHSPLFALRQVDLQGAISQVTGNEVAELVRRDIRGNFVTVDVALARAAFEKLPWVRRAAVRRQWPGRLEVRIEEHVPIARWGADALVNTQGEIFKADFQGELPAFGGPPELAKEIAIQYEYFRSALATIGRRPLQVSVSSRRAWEIRLDGGTVLELGREHVEERLARFVAVYGRTIGRLNRRIEYVDLRYPGGFAVRIPELRDGAPRERRKGRA
jgi:cell division protein FtsQ